MTCLDVSSNIEDCSLHGSGSGLLGQDLYDSLPAVAFRA